MTQSEHVKVISEVIHGMKKTEILLQAKEGDERNKCFICDRYGHKMKKQNKEGGVRKNKSKRRSKEKETRRK
jgi:hypothetical protein